MRNRSYRMAELHAAFQHAGGLQALCGLSEPGVRSSSGSLTPDGVLDTAGLLQICAYILAPNMYQLQRPRVQLSGGTHHARLRSFREGVSLPGPLVRHRVLTHGESQDSALSTRHLRSFNRVAPRGFEQNLSVSAQLC